MLCNWVSGLCDNSKEHGAFIILGLLEPENEGTKIVPLEHWELHAQHSIPSQNTRIPCNTTIKTLEM
jgi:hypothetical protein